MGALGAAPPAKRRVPVFRSGAGGYGDAVRAQRKDTYHRVYGSADLRWGDIREGLPISQLGAASQKAEPPLPQIFEWEESSGQPCIYALQADAIRQFKGGAPFTIATLAAVATGAAMHDDGSGVPYLYIGEGGTSTNKIQKMDRAQTVTTVTNIYGDKLLSIAGDFYLTAKPASGTANCGVGKIAAGTNPSTAAQPSLSIVGQPGRNINNLAALRYAPVCLKPEGVFSYDRNSDTWINHARWLEHAPHPDNGKAYWYEGTDLIVALGAGGALRFDGYSCTPYDLLPLDTSTPNVDTTSQLVACGGTMRHWGAVVTKAGAKRQRHGGGTRPDTLATIETPLVLKKFDGAAYTDYSSQVTDDLTTTYADFSALDPVTAPADYILVGHVQPFFGVYMGIRAANTNNSSMTAAIWNGAAWVATSITSQMSVGAGTITLGRSGWIVFANFGPTVDPVADPAYGWQPSTIDGYTRYWMKLTPTLALSATVQVSEVFVVPYRPSLDRTNFPADAHDRAGLLPHIILSRTREDGEHVVHDMGSLPRVDEIGALIFGPAGTGQYGGNDERSLLLWGKIAIYGLFGSYDDRPATFSWPTGGPISGVTPKVLVELAAIDLQAQHTIVAVELDGYDFIRSGFVYYTFDDGKPWTLAGRFSNLPAVVEVKNSDRAGRYLRLAVGWTGTHAQGGLPIAPRVTLVDALVTPSAARPVHLQRRTAAPVV